MNYIKKLEEENRLLKEQIIQMSKVQEMPKNELGNVLARRVAIEKMLQRGLSLTTIFTQSEDINIKNANDIMTDDFLKVLEQKQPGITAMWTRWKDKYLK